MRATTLKPGGDSDTGEEAPLNNHLSEPDAQPGSLTWEYPIPLLTSRFMLRDLTMVIVLSMAVMQLLLIIVGFLVSGEPVLLPLFVYAVVTGVMIVLFFIAIVLMGNRYDMGFRVTAKGLDFATGSRQARRNRVWRALALVSGNATAAGSAILASSQDKGFYSWKDIRKVTVHPGPRVITLSNAWRPVLRLYCHRENYAAVEAAVLGYFRQAEETRAAVAARAAPTGTPAPATSAYARALPRILAWTLASAAATVAALLWYDTAFDDQWRLVILAGVLVWGAGLPRVSPVRRILGLGGLALGLYLLFLLIGEATRPITGPSGTIYGTSYEVDTLLLAFAFAGHLALMGMSGWRLFGPADHSIN